MNIRNLLDNLPIDLSDEHFDTLLQAGGVRIERIVSKGHRSPESGWYDQEEDEWVLLLQGEAELLFEGQEEPIHMRTGDSLNIPAHRRHRVQWTPADRETVWLAVFYRPNG